MQKLLHLTLSLKGRTSLLLSTWEVTVNCVDHNKLWKILKEMGLPTTLPASGETYMQVRKQQLELDME